MDMLNEQWNEICHRFDDELLAPMCAECGTGFDTGSALELVQIPETNLCLIVGDLHPDQRVRVPIATGDKAAIGEAQRIAILTFAFRAAWTTTSVLTTLIAGPAYAETQRKDMEARLRGYVASSLLVRKLLRGNENDQLHAYALGLRGAQLLREYRVADAFGRVPVGLRDGDGIKSGPTPDHDLVAQHVLATAQFNGHEVVHEKELRRLHGNQRSTRTPDGLVIDAEATKAVYVERARKTGWEARQQSRTIARITEDGVAYGPYVATDVVMVGVRTHGVHHELRQAAIGRYSTRAHEVRMLLCDAGRNGRPINTRIIDVQVPCATDWDLLVQIRSVDVLRNWIDHVRRFGLGDGHAPDAHIGFEAERADHRLVFGDLILDRYGNASLLAQTSAQSLWWGPRPITTLEPGAFGYDEHVVARHLQRAIWEAIRTSHLAR